MNRRTYGQAKAVLAALGEDFPDVLSPKKNVMKQRKTAMKRGSFIAVFKKTMF